MRLTGRVAIVTGAAGGIGRGIALELARDGASIVVADVNQTGSDRVVEEIKALGREALAVRTDVSRSQEVNSMARIALERFGRIDTLVNDAGGSARGRNGPFHKSSEEVWDYVLGINLKGVLNCSRAVINHMMERRKGTIVNIASISGVVGSPGRADYSAAKGGIIAFTKALAKEVAGHGVRVVAVSPGFIDTVDWLRRLSKEEADELMRKNMPPVGRIGTAADIARMVAFLASDEAGYITGHNFIVDGGTTLRVEG